MAIRGGCGGEGSAAMDEKDRNRDADEMRESLKKWTNSPGLFPTPSKEAGSGAPLTPPLMSLGEPVLAKGEAAEVFKGPKMITFDGDQTLYSDGANFEGNPELANYLYLLLRHGVTLAVVTAAGYEYQTERYEMRLSGLLAYFKSKNLPAEDCERFYLFGGECNFLLKLGSDYKLHAVKEVGPGGWKTATKFIKDAPGNWNENEIQSLLDVAETSVDNAVKDLKIRGRVIRKKRSVGLIPNQNQIIPREALDETVLRVHEKLGTNTSITLPFCAFNGGRDVWIDVGNKRVGVRILASYLGIPNEQTIHVGDQFLNTGNDYAARGVCPCIWITNPDETTYILKSILRLAGVPLDSFPEDDDDGEGDSEDMSESPQENLGACINFSTFTQRHSMTNLNGITALPPLNQINQMAQGQT